MSYEVFLLIGLILVFIMSFCGLLQKIRESYEQERLTEQGAQRSNSLTISGMFLNSVFTVENGSDAVFCAPPAYTDLFMDVPPSYEDVIKQENELTNNRDHRIQRF